MPPTVLPIITAVAGMGFLGWSAVLSTRAAFSRARKEDALPPPPQGGRVAAAPKPLPATLRELAQVELAGGERLGALGLRAFAYGTVLCLVGSSALLGLAAWALDVRSMAAFSEKMRCVMPQLRADFEGGLRPALGGIGLPVGSQGGAAAAAQREEEERVLEGVLAGLNSVDRAALKEALEAARGVDEEHAKKGHRAATPTTS